MKNERVHESIDFKVCSETGSSSTSSDKTKTSSKAMLSTNLKAIWKKYWKKINKENKQNKTNKTNKTNYFEKKKTFAFCFCFSITSGGRSFDLEITCWSPIWKFSFDSKGYSKKCFTTDLLHLIYSLKFISLHPNILFVW